MAKYAGVWGIDIGQAAFKALRCHMENGQVVADAFDYIEYPKILSQPEAEPEKMVHDAIEQFLSRNEVKGYDVALAVPGQSGLAKFFKPPPVDPKKIPDIVKYEARQQIPFALEDVVWDYQQMGAEESSEGYALETEVGLFAMKRDQVYRAMKPFDEVGVELDLIQLSPLSIYNFISYDILGEQVATEEYDPENPMPSLVVLSMGTDTTDLVITNGIRVWQRSVPLGGNHFTKQLTKELKLTFAKAEHLKRNVRQAEDPKMVFQAMRPVFNDLVTEVQRSIGYFQGIDRKAKIDGVVILGNAVKLPGLQQYLAKNLGYQVNNFETFSHLGGTAVTSAPAFRDNRLSFSACYGLCLQGLNQSKLRTNLVPSEIVTDRLVRSKKPWALASVAALLLACTFNVFFYWNRLHQATEDWSVSGVSWTEATSRMDVAATKSQSLKSKDGELMQQLERITAIGEELVGNTDRQVMWLEILRTLNVAMPVTPGVEPGEVPDVEELPFSQRQEIHVEQLETQYFDDLTEWFNEIVEKKYIDQMRNLSPADEPEGEDAQTAETVEVEGPSETGWVIQLECYHYFNEDRQREGITHVLDTLVQNLKNGRVAFPVAAYKIQPGNVLRHRDQDGEYYPLHVTAVNPIMESVGGSDQVTGYEFKLEGVSQPVTVGVKDDLPVVFTMKEMGIDYPLVLEEQPIDREHKVPNPNYDPRSSRSPEGEGYPGGGGYPGSGGYGEGYPSAGGMAGGSGMESRLGPRSSGGSESDSTEEGQKIEPEPRMLEVPRYDCTVQFVWKDQLLTDRLQAQVDEWKNQEPGTSVGEDSELAVNTSGGN